MITIKSIKALIFNPDEQNRFTDRFTSLPAIKHFCYSSEEQLQEIIKTIRLEYDSKEVIILKKYQGRIFQNCPATPKMMCCNYRLINTGYNCLYNCAYCYLQIYLNSFGIQLFSNMDDLYSEIDPFLNEASADMVYRIGTGEFTDSLMIDEVSGIGEKLITLFSNHPNMMLELKTKSDNVEHLLGIKNKGSAVIGWSVNTPTNVALYEEGAATLDERLAAAAKAAAAGFYTAFHFDPIIMSDGWEHDYRWVVNAIFDTVPAESVVWISMGGFRYQNPFADVLQKNFPDEKMSLGEFFPGEDMKYRYLWQLRRKLYMTIRDAVFSRSTHPYLYMCMESSEMWKDIFNKDFTSPDEHEIDFAEHLKFILRMSKK